MGVYETQKKFFIVREKQTNSILYEAEQTNIQKHETFFVKQKQ